MSFEQESEIAWPPGPRCERCGHVISPCWGHPWCEVHYIAAEDEDCCGGDCLVSLDDYSQWQQDISAVEDGGDPVARAVIAEGPWWPASMRGEAP